jgi:hypothetical protein
MHTGYTHTRTHTHKKSRKNVRPLHVYKKIVQQDTRSDAFRHEGVLGSRWGASSLRWYLLSAIGSYVMGRKRAITWTMRSSSSKLCNAFSSLMQCFTISHWKRALASAQNHSSKLAAAGAGHWPQMACSALRVTRFYLCTSTYVKEFSLNCGRIT